MERLVPKKLSKGDEVRVIAPARSLSLIKKDARKYARKNLSDLGLTLSFGKHVEETDDFSSSSIEARVDDIHNAFLDKNVKAILTVIGGFNSNQLLESIDWNLIRENPKILCGYSDITILNNSIFAKTGLVSYYGPHYSTFGQKLHLEYTIDYFKKCLVDNNSITIEPSESWTDDAWYIDQDNRKLINNAGYNTINSGTAEGTIIGGNLCTLNLLQGTEYMPSLIDALLFIEDDYESDASTFDRDLQSLIHQRDFEYVKGIVIGRFQKESEMTDDLLEKIVKTKKELVNIPIISNVDFGHTDPKITFPIGGFAKIRTDNGKAIIELVEH